jgi:hypothetical protein
MTPAEFDVAVEAAEIWLSGKWVLSKKRFVDPFDWAGIIVADALEKGKLPQDDAGRMAISWTIKRLRFPVRMPFRPNRTDARNVWLAMLIDDIVGEYGCPVGPGRESQHRHNACSIVAQALKRMGIHISAVGLAKIWERWRPARRTTKLH